MRLATSEFIPRFLIHVLLDGVQRIRHDGLLASSAHKANVAKIRALLRVRPPEQVAVPEPQTEIAAPALREPCTCRGGPRRIIEIFRRRQNRCRSATRGSSDPNELCPAIARIARNYTNHARPCRFTKFTGTRRPCVARHAQSQPIL